MFLQYSKRQQACALGLLDRASKILRRQFFPVHRKLRLRPGQIRADKHHGEHQSLVHKKPLLKRMNIDV
jgi:hypothetical protein